MPLKQEIRLALDEIGSFWPLGEGCLTEDVPGRESHSTVDRFMHGGEFGLVVYPDGSTVQARENDILHRRHRLTGALIDRISAKNPPADVRFMTYEEYVAEKGNFRSYREMVIEEMRESGSNGGMLFCGGDHLIHFPQSQRKKINLQ